MSSIVGTISRHLPRGLKDHIPQPLKELYYRKKDARWRRSIASLDYMAELITSLQTVPFEAYALRDTENLGEMAPVPEQVAAIEINDSCNLNCPMCETAAAARKKGLMDLTLFEDTVAMLAERGTRTTNFHTVGDPTANKRLPDYLAILRKYKFTIHHLSSNCQLLDRHLDTIFEYRDVISSFRPSIDAASKGTYEILRAGASWETLHRNLITFADRNSRLASPIPVLISSVISKVNFHEIGLIPWVYSYLTDPMNHNFAFMMGIGAAVPFFQKEGYLGQDYRQNSPCTQNWDNMVILKDGSVSTCCTDYDGDLIIGHIKDGTLDEIYNGDRVRQIRRAHITRDAAGQPNLCQNCLIVDRRNSILINAIIQYFYQTVRRHPMRLQNALNVIGPMLQTKQYDGILPVVEAL